MTGSYIKSPRAAVKGRRKQPGATAPLRRKLKPNRDNYSNCFYPYCTEWCSSFLSWVADQCGYLDAGMIPRMDGVRPYVDWFIERGQWTSQDNMRTPNDNTISTGSYRILNSSGKTKIKIIRFLGLLFSSSPGLSLYRVVFIN